MENYCGLTFTVIIECSLHLYVAGMTKRFTSTLTVNLFTSSSGRDLRQHGIGLDYDAALILFLWKANMFLKLSAYREQSRKGFQTSNMISIKRSLRTQFFIAPTHKRVGNLFSAIVL